MTAHLVRHATATVITKMINVMTVETTGAMMVGMTGTMTAKTTIVMTAETTDATVVEMNSTIIAETIGVGRKKGAAKAAPSLYTLSFTYFLKIV